jgi:hypothetical protein
MSVTMEIITTDPVNIYWGDGTVDYDVTTETGEVAHTYSVPGTYYIVITGIIENITAVTTGATLIWSKLL